MIYQVFDFILVPDSVLSEKAYCPIRTCKNIYVRSPKMTFIIYALPTLATYAFLPHIALHPGVVYSMDKKKWLLADVSTNIWCSDIAQTNTYTTFESVQTM